MPPNAGAAFEVSAASCANDTALSHFKTTSSSSFKLVVVFPACATLPKLTFASVVAGFAPKIFPNTGSVLAPKIDPLCKVLKLLEVVTAGLEVVVVTDPKMLGFAPNMAEGWLKMLPELDTDPKGVVPFDTALAEVVAVPKVGAVLVVVVVPNTGVVALEAPKTGVTVAPNAGLPPKMLPEDDTGPSGVVPFPKIGVIVTLEDKAEVPNNDVDFCPKMLLVVADAPKTGVVEVVPVLLVVGVLAVVLILPNNGVVAFSIFSDVGGFAPPKTGVELVTLPKTGAVLKKFEVAVVVA